MKDFVLFFFQFHKHTTRRQHTEIGFSSAFLEFYAALKTRCTLKQEIRKRFSHFVDMSQEFELSDTINFHVSRNGEFEKQIEEVLRKLLKSFWRFEHPQRRKKATDFSNWFQRFFCSSEFYGITHRSISTSVKAANRKSIRESRQKLHRKPQIRITHVKFLIINYFLRLSTTLYNDAFVLDRKTQKTFLCLLHVFAFDFLRIMNIINKKPGDA